MKKEIKIVSLPRLKRLNIQADTRYSKRQHYLFYIDKFTVLENRFTHHPDGGEAMYKQWLISQINEYEDVYREIRKMYGLFHYNNNDKDVSLIFLVSSETPPIHAQIIRNFIMSCGEKL